MTADILSHHLPRGAALLRSDTTRAIWRAAIIELAHAGYERLSIDRIAKRAGVGKAALYRRWPNKEAMVIALLAASQQEVVAVEDNGSLDDDIRDYLEKAARLLRRPLSMRILPSFYAELSRDTDLADAIRRTVQQSKREGIILMVKRAVARGELVGTQDYELAFDLVIGPIFWRAIVTRSPMDGYHLDALAGAIAAALRTQARTRYDFEESNEYSRHS